MSYGAFRKAASALSYTLARDRYGAVAPEFPVNRVVRFVMDQHGRLPDYMRFPLKVLTVLFDYAAVLRHGRRFHKLPHDKRCRRIEAWRQSWLGPFRDLIRLYEALVVYCCFSITHD